MSETWKPVVGYEGLYSVSNQGRVRRDAGGSGARIGRILRPSNVGSDGHLGVNLHRNRKATGFKVHRLVLVAFVGPCPEGMECCHGDDGNPRNNALANLRWDTHAANLMDRVRHGTSNRGERHWMKKLTAQDIQDIRRSVAAGKTRAARPRSPAGCLRRTWSLSACGREV